MKKTPKTISTYKITQICTSDQTAENGTFRHQRRCTKCAFMSC